MFGVLKDPFSVLSKKQRRGAIQAVFFSLLLACLDTFSLAAVIPIFYGLFANDVDASFLNIDMNVLHAYWRQILLVIIGLFLLKNFLGLWLARRQSNFISDIAVSLTEKLYRQFYTQPWTDYLKDNTAEVARKIKTTPSDYAQYIVQGYILFMSDFVTCLLMTALMIAYDVRVVLLVLVLSIPLAITYLFFKRKITSRIDRAFRVSTPEASIVLGQGIDSFSEARIYGKESFFIERFMKLRKLTSQQLADLRTATQVPSRLFELTGILCFCSVVAYGKLYQGTDASMAILLGLLSLAIYRIIPSLNRMMMTLSQMEAYGYAISEIKKGFNESETETNYEPIRFEETLELRGLSFSYDHHEKKVLHQINFTIRRGDFVLVEGPSGVGKSTLLHLLAGLLPDYGGQLIADGKPVHAGALQKKIAFVPQAPILIQDTLAKNIAFADDTLDETKLDRACAIAGLTDFVNSLPNRYLGHIGERGTNVSGGQRQRINLARALYRDADILILDEVTNQLDHQTKEHVLRKLKDLCTEGKTIILSSHDRLIKPYASKTLTLG